MRYCQQSIQSDCREDQYRIVIVQDKVKRESEQCATKKSADKISIASSL